MGKFLSASLAAMLLAAPAWAGPRNAADDCNTCPPPPRKDRYAEVCETVQVEVPCIEYVDVPCEVNVTRMVEEEEEVPIMTTQWTYEPREVTEMKRVTECEEYQTEVTKTMFTYETRTRQVPKIVEEMEEKLVTKRIPRQECDPNTGCPRVVYDEVCESITVPVKRRIMVDEEYECRVAKKVPVSVTRTRKVTRMVPVTKTVMEPKCNQVPSTKIVKVRKPVCETKTIMRRRAVRTTKLVDKTVCKKVLVQEPAPCPEPVPTDCDPCKKNGGW